MASRDRRRRGGAAWWPSITFGFGLSDRPPNGSYRPEDHAARFRAFMAAVCPDGPLTLVVHDFGGPIALDWALDHPSGWRTSW